jgi:hypothetical protein
MVELFRQADLEPRITHVMAATNRSMVLLEDKGKPRPWAAPSPLAAPRGEGAHSLSP